MTTANFTKHAQSALGVPSHTVRVHSTNDAWNEGTKKFEKLYAVWFEHVDGKPCTRHPDGYFYESTLENFK